MATLQGVDRQHLNERQKAVADAILQGPRKRVGPLMALWLHSPELAASVQQVGAYFRQTPAIPRLVVEMVILTTARHWLCGYEWVAHEPTALAEGLPREIIESLRVEEVPDFARLGEGPAAAHAFACAMLSGHAAPDHVVQAVVAAFGTRGVVDISILIGHYIHGAILAQAAGLRPPADAAAPF